MSWDLKLGADRDLRPGYATGADEVVQRLITRLMRDEGSWFRYLPVGVPWYFQGRGILGNKSKEYIDLLLRGVILETEGVERIVKMNSIYHSEERKFDLYMELLINSQLLEITLDQGQASWRMA